MAPGLDTRQPDLEKLNATGKARVWIQVGTLIEGSGEKPTPDAHIVYDHERILFVGSANERPEPELIESSSSGTPRAEPDLVLPEITALPGLIDAHAHLFLEGNLLDPETRKAQLALSPEALVGPSRRRLERLLLAGVMGIRDAGDNKGVGLALRGRSFADNGNPPAAYIESPGPAIHHRGRYGSFMSSALEDYDDPRTCVDRLCELGVDRIKLIATGIINFKKGQVTSPPQMSTEELSDFVAASRHHDKLTFAHASGTDGIECVIAAGIDSVEHGYFVSDEQLLKMRDRNICWVPTFVPVQIQIDRAQEMGWDATVVDHLERIIEAHSKSLAKAQEIGTAVLAGSDAGSCGVAHGLGLIHELELMERASLSSLAVIASATGQAAKFLGLKEKLGRIEPGYRSRMILTRHSPLDGVANLRREKTLIVDGQALFEDGKLDPVGL